MDINSINNFKSIINTNSPTKLIMIVLSITIWLIGGNILTAYHYRRQGKPFWHGFNPFACPLRKFNKGEWIWLGILFVVSFSLMILAFEHF